MALGDLNGHVRRKPAEDRKCRRCVSENAEMRLTCHAIENHSSKFQLRIKGPKSLHHRSDASRQWIRINDENDREIQPLRHFRRAPGVRTSVEPIKEAHHTFD